MDPFASRSRPLPWLRTRWVIHVRQPLFCPRCVFSLSVTLLHSGGDSLRSFVPVSGKCSGWLWLASWLCFISMPAQRDILLVPNGVIRLAAAMLFSSFCYHVDTDNSFSTPTPFSSNPPIDRQGALIFLRNKPPLVGDGIGNGTRVKATH